MPVHVVEKLNKIMRTERKLRAERGREPSNEEIAVDLDMTVEEVESIRRTSQTPVSLEKPVGDEERVEVQQVADRHVEINGDLLVRRLAATLGAQLALGAHDLVQLLDHVHRACESSEPCRRAPSDRLADPPGRE